MHRRFLTGFRKRKALRRKKAAEIKESIEKEKKKQQRAQVSTDARECQCCLYICNLSKGHAGSRDRLEVRTLRCGRNNPGSNPGHGTFLLFFFAEKAKGKRCFAKI